MNREQRAYSGIPKPFGGGGARRGGNLHSCSDNKHQPWSLTSVHSWNWNFYLQVRSISGAPPSQTMISISMAAFVCAQLGCTPAPVFLNISHISHLFRNSSRLYFHLKTAINILSLVLSYFISMGFVEGEEYVCLTCHFEPETPVFQPQSFLPQPTLCHFFDFYLSH